MPPIVVRSCPRLPCFCLLAAFLASCGTTSAPTTSPPLSPAPTTPPAPARAAPAEGAIHFECQPADALVTVDGEARGTVEAISRRGGLRLQHGLHRFELSKEGFETYRLELKFGPGGETIRVQLRPAAPRP